MQQIFKFVALEDKYTYYIHVRYLSYERYNNIQPLLNHKLLYIMQTLIQLFMYPPERRQQDQKWSHAVTII